MTEIFIVLACLLPILAGGFCLLYKQLTPAALENIAILTTALELGLVFAVFRLVNGEGIHLPFTAEMEFSLSPDLLGRFFALFVGVVWFFVTLYAFPYMAHEGGERRFFGWMLCTLGAVVGVAYAGNILTLYLFFEIMTLASAPMVMHSLTRETKQAAAAYLVYSVLGATLGLFGSLYLQANMGRPLPVGAQGMFHVMAFLAIVGFCCKAGLAPFHVWLPLAHPVAPAPASAVLSGVITKCGAIAAIRVLYQVARPGLLQGSWVQYTLVTMALCTILLGSTLAYHEKVLKKRLAYSSVSQLSYLLLGVFLMSFDGLLGALLQLLFHGLAKATLFLCAGAIILLLHKTRVDEISGCGKKLPLVMCCFAVASLSLVGIPPLGGATSKWQLAVAGLGSGLGVLSYIIPVVLLVSALLTAGYLFSIVQNAFWGNPAPALAAAEVKTPWRISVALVALCAGLVFFGCFPGALVDYLAFAVAAII